MPETSSAARIRGGAAVSYRAASGRRTYSRECHASQSSLELDRHIRRDMGTFEKVLPTPPGFSQALWSLKVVHLSSLASVAVLGRLVPIGAVGDGR
jgi:hypothetical protein